MTFYESALAILEKAGSPLHADEITKRSLDEGLLSHIGKNPELTMLARLASMAKRSRDRRLMVTQKDTFALTDWMLHEDAEALAQTGVPVANPFDGQPPLRPAERHPMPRAEYLRTIGRQAERERKRRDDEPKKRSIPLAELAFELLSSGTVALTPPELLAQIKAKEGLRDEVSVGALLDALAEDNQRRIDANRRPQFSALKTDQGQVQISLETDASSHAVTVQESFCAATGLPFEEGRFRSSKETRSVQPRVEGDEAALAQTARLAVKDARRTVARSLRKKLSELELGTFEKACVRLLHGQHFRELKVARRAREGALLTARRREGSIELRYAIRMLKGGNSVERRTIQELRKDTAQANAHVGLLLSPGDVRGDARQEATNGTLVFLWCGDGLAEKFCEAHTGVKVTQVELFEIDEAFFVQAKVDGEEAQRRREERHREKERQRPVPGAETSVADETATQAVAADEANAVAVTNESDDTEADDEGESEPGAGETSGSVPGAEGDAARKRKRKRRRRRRGGNRPEGAIAAPAEGGSASGEATSETSAAATEVQPSAAAPSADEPAA
jgi:ribonuclease E